MASTDIWSDFETLRHNIKHNTVEKLKQILTGFNEECSTLFFKSGKKQDIIDRIVAQLDNWRLANNTDKWIKAKAVLYQVRTSGIYSPSAISANPTVHPAPTTSHNPYATTTNIKPFGYPPTASGSGANYDPFMMPRKPPVPAVPVASTSTAHKPGMRFKPSPFFHIDQIVSAIVECPESTSATDRRQQTVTFSLNNDQIVKLKSTSSKYQLRLFCTSSTFYSPSVNGFRPNTGPCSIEFPPTCEVRVNNVQLTANLKGLKKKPGTAPPADLGKAVRISPIQNRVEMVYVNSQQPIQSKKFYLVVFLVEITTVGQLVEKLKKGKYRSSSEVRRKMLASMTEDDDIVAGPQKMSLKCPLSFMRVKTPCRSIHCVHSQCFDATSWYSMMEQTTTWLCPVCEKVLNYEDLIIDGYFDEILKQTPESVEDVIVEADGEWHTADDSHASAAWKASHPPSVVDKPSSPRKSSPIAASLPESLMKPTTDQNGNEIVVLDSDDEDEGQVKRELSPSFGRDSPASANRSLEGISILQSQSQGDGVIDLTLDSDDDAPPPPRLEKRKAAEGGMSPTEQIWKKRRQDNEPASVLPMPSDHVNGSGSLDGNPYPPYSSHRSQSGQSVSRPPMTSPHTQYIPQFQATTGPPTYSYHRPPPPRNPVTSNAQLSSLPYLPGINNARWPRT